MWFISLVEDHVRCNMDYKVRWNHNNCWDHMMRMYKNLRVYHYMRGYAHPQRHGSLSGMFLY
jgi:hypothetical protein